MGRWFSGLCVLLDLSGIVYTSPVAGCSSRGIVLGSAYISGVALSGAALSGASSGGGVLSVDLALQ